LYVQQKLQESKTRQSVEVTRFRLIDFVERKKSTRDYRPTVVDLAKDPGVKVVDLAKDPGVKVVDLAKDPGV
ncbi:MAG: hypothetical protein ACK6AT_17850, partial [Planctomycetota bacterium]